MKGAQGLGRGIASGLKDLKTKPMEGARDGGALGFAKGVGSGALGFGTKTASGTIDLATSMLAGAKNTPEAVEKKIQEARASGTIPGSLFGSSSAVPDSSGAAGEGASALGDGSTSLFGGAGDVPGQSSNGGGANDPPAINSSSSSSSGLRTF